MSDAHFDARTTALDPRFELVAAAWLHGSTSHTQDEVHQHPLRSHVLIHYIHRP